MTIIFQFSSFRFFFFAKMQSEKSHSEKSFTQIIMPMEIIQYPDFEKVELRVGTIIDAQIFPEARKPAYKLTIDFGTEIGIKKSSAQITEYYTLENLIGKQIIAVVNFPTKQIGPFISECLTTGLPDEQGHVVLISPDHRVPNGVKLF